MSGMFSQQLQDLQTALYHVHRWAKGFAGVESTQGGGFHLFRCTTRDAYDQISLRINHHVGTGVFPKEMARFIDASLTIVIGPQICENCKLAFSDHATGGKCLFEPTQYTESKPK